MIRKQKKICSLILQQSSILGDTWSCIILNGSDCQVDGILLNLLFHLRTV